MDTSPTTVVLKTCDSHRARGSSSCHTSLANSSLRWLPHLGPDGAFWPPAQVINHGQRAASVESQPSVAHTICSALTVAERPVACNRFRKAQPSRLLPLSLHFSVSPAGNQGPSRFWEAAAGSSWARPWVSDARGSRLTHFRWDSLDFSALTEGLQEDRN